MSTVPGYIPVLLVSFPGPSANLPLELIVIRSMLRNQRLPIVALLPFKDYPLPDGLHDQFYSVITNTKDTPQSQYAYRLDALDLLERHSNMEVVAVMELDQDYRGVWDGIPMMETR